MTTSDRVRRIVERRRRQTDLEIADRIAHQDHVASARAIVRREPGLVVIEVDRGAPRVRVDSTPPPPLTAHLPRDSRTLAFDTRDVTPARSKR